MARVRSGEERRAATVLRLYDEWALRRAGSVGVGDADECLQGAAGSAVSTTTRLVQRRCCGSDAGEPVLRAREARVWL